MSDTSQILTVRIGRVPVLIGLQRKPVVPRRCEVFATWAKSGGFAKNRLHYTLRRQPFINHSVDENGVHIVNYWGPMTKDRVMKIVRSINTDPTAGLNYQERNMANP